MGRIIGFGLMICFAAVLRSDPQLRAVVADVALRVAGAGVGEQDRGTAPNPQDQAIANMSYASGSAEAKALEELGLPAKSVTVVSGASGLPQSHVKINRPAADTPRHTNFRK